VSHATLGNQPNYDYAFSTAEQDTGGNKTTNHSVAISGLTSGTNYFYRTVSVASPESVSEENNFTTLAQGGTSSGSYLPGYGPNYVAQAPAPVLPVAPVVPQISTLVLPPVAFSLNLGRWMVNLDVKRLQQFLNTHGFILSSSGAGSPGNETLTFGPRTKSAVKKFQASQGIKRTGFFGPITRATVNLILQKEQ